ncbi:phage terminase large subunit family protein [Thalassovita sp.]|uniref:phage terminase large subunit family protein n=1 Tax=Thalassovita sp. TaxID=1979401 RepID=UPI0029DE703F|nr:phage terminase large subunit family protein [Thalassovita sp.]
MLCQTMRRALTVLTPPPDLTISDWADANRRLSSEASAEPGRWRTSRAEFQRGIMEAVSDAATETVVIMSSSQVGKALALDTPLVTPTGWTTMGDVQVGDILFDETGAPCRVTAATDVMRNRRCYRVRFSDGSSIIADAEHLWAVDSDTPVRAQDAMRDLFHDYPPGGPNDEGDC